MITKGQLVTAFHEKANGRFEGIVLEVKDGYATIEPTKILSGGMFMDYIVKERIHTIVPLHNIKAKEGK